MSDSAQHSDSSQQSGPGELEQRFGTSKHPEREVARPRPSHATDADIDALGKLGAALEAVEQARGFLYNFHRLSGTADLELGEAVQALRDAGHDDVAQDIERTLIGRDIIEGYWSFQLVEEYDRGYYDVFRAAEQHARQRLGVELPHVYEAEMKHREQSG